jgi:alpha-galactosidase
MINLQGKLVANAATFPFGIKALADYVHNKGLKLRIYSDAGYEIQELYSSFHIGNNHLGKACFLNCCVVSRLYTCSERQPGSLGYEKIDADTFVDWVHTSKSSYSVPWCFTL